jgi:hypothetical protein
MSARSCPGKCPEHEGAKMSWPFQSMEWPIYSIFLVLGEGTGTCQRDDRVSEWDEHCHYLGRSSNIIRCLKASQINTPI